MNDIHLDNFDLNLLRVLRAVLEERSVTRAGARLGITQSAVSHALSRLRAALEDPLVVRTPTGMHPTPRGAEIAAALPAAFEQLRDALLTAGFNAETSQRVFTVVAGPYVCAVVLPALMARVLREAPGVSLRIRTLTPEMVDRLGRGDVDLMIGLHGAGPAHLYKEAMFEESLVWIVRKGHALARSEAITVAALASAPHVLIDQGNVFEPFDVARAGTVIDQGAFSRELAKRGLTQRVGMVVSDTMSALAIVSQTDMIALVPRRLAMLTTNSGGLKVIAPPYASRNFSIGLLARADRMESPDMAWLTSRLRDVAAAMAA